MEGGSAGNFEIEDSGFTGQKKLSHNGEEKK
jgi:hypothetical protein